MITKINNFFKGCLVGCVVSLVLTSCSDFLYDDSDIVVYADRDHLTSDGDTLWSVAGIINKMQAVADRTILLGELRGDLVSVTASTENDLRDLASFTIKSGNKYNSPSDYYAVINNCNYFIAKADTALKNNRNEYIFMKEYAAVKAFRAWTYLQLVTIYGQVPLVTEPILSKEQSEQNFRQCGIQEICQYFIDDIAPYAEVETPGYGTIRNTESRLFFFPVYALLGDLNLWAGNYRAAAENYYKYLSKRNGRNSAFTTGLSSVRFLQNDNHWTSISDAWSSQFSMAAEQYTAASEIITMIPGDSIPSEGNYSQLRNLFNSTEANDYKESIVASQALYDLSAAQKYCHYSSGGEYVIAPSNLTEHRNGDLRLQACFRVSKDLNIKLLNGNTVTSMVTNSKYMSRNIHVYRRAVVYLRLAEALNRAGFPRFAFQILKSGVNNTVINNEVLPYYPADAAWLSTFDFRDDLYVLETKDHVMGESTLGIHSRGCGFSTASTEYVMPTDATLSGQALTDYEIEKVEDLIMDEEALELAFEGYRFGDLMRVALRRGDSSYLADRIAKRSGTVDVALKSRLDDKSNWFLQIEN